MLTGTYDDISVPADHSDIQSSTTTDDASVASYMITVTNPQKVDGKTTYVAYEVTAEATTGSKEKLVSVRRYSDFLWLHDQLQSHNRSIVIPPMPEKSITGKFSAELLLFRSRELTRFLMRISTHPKLSKDEHFIFFLSAPTESMNLRRDAVEKVEEKSAEASGGGGWFSSFKKRATDAKLAVVGSEEDDNPYFKEIEESLKAKNALLSQMLQNSQSLVARWHRISVVYQSHAERVRSFSRVAKGTDEKVSAMYSEDATACDQTVKLASEFATKLEHTHHDSIRDFMRENDAIQCVINERMKLVRSYNALCKEAEKGSVTLERRNQALAELDSFSKEAQTEIERTMALRECDMNYIAEALARFHRSVYKQLVEHWALTCSSIRE